MPDLSRLTACLLAATLWCSAWAPDAGARPPTGKKSGQIDLAICLDTSNSMDGLIGSAKQQLWDIVNELAKAEPAPTLRVALYSYGNDDYVAKRGWVRKEMDFSTDLDGLSERLFGLKTRGGTEYVGRVSRDALADLEWSSGSDVLKLVFVCGNEPADQDPDVSLKKIASTAKSQDAILNTIYCGNAGDKEATSWRHLASLAGGRFSVIDQERGQVSIPTPYDKPLAELGEKLNDTFLFHGRDSAKKTENQLAQDANAAKLSSGAAAARAQSKAGSIYRSALDDLVERSDKDSNFDIASVPEADLPAKLKELRPEARKARVHELSAERKKLQKEIGELGKKREAYLRAEAKKRNAKGSKALGEAVGGMLREQAKTKGIDIPE
ncbi:MAG: VWA domain-containing protein [Candidatus Sericytochromatia bacterium]|uniref:VWA domain-containing protein n=1 Tax=Candidatus Tanganyikabacteria bacterium TaxID=2961651 RepID=A0A937X428_9BACT|nr:VWA domain-containing protein [Candidatus Tanganyikabacteria bacterium]